MKKQTEIISIDHPHALDKAVDIIDEGGVIAFPTDTVYGIGVSAFNEYSIERLFRVKGRSLQKAIPILIGDARELIKITAQVPSNAKKLIDLFWPGALTLIFELDPDLPENLSPTGTIGVRLPDHEFALDLLKATRPLAVTSANLAGKASALTAEQVRDQLDGKIDLILDGGRVQGGTASTVLDCTGEEFRIIREGPISWKDLKIAIDG